ncbi:MULTISPECIES: DUF378 domain-containing protein [unclassified Caballeronia]|jgi:uncharacterized membrane protein YuzA (DUF378 family)|uniref:DUF378 domain-containing protein n=1 Tax=unclassified Caballeronia TaxID=2646786 RepID=UPI000D5EB76D|nr:MULTISPECIES: DUF378 domain-containing protein [unclassified Caballeronia]MDR5755304.1 DUF378 domain-containing protein [Caballeronia sp. LZ024]MDR5841659.1 DUF378 domain-containing protein [Caballeronia sp. LZ031]
MPTITSKGTVGVRRSPVDWVAGALVIIGGLNWGLVGLLRFDLVAAIFGAGSAGSRIVYVLVGLAALYALIRAFVPAREQQLVHR